MSGSSKAALVVAHPGHELRVYGWLEGERPEVFVLTDGSGSAGGSRVPSTAEILRRAGARPGSVFGRFSDRELYEVILEGRIEVLTELARELADDFVEGSVEMVAADAIEGFNPSHDVCRLLTDAAVALARRRTGREIASYDFLLEGRPDALPVNGHSGVLRLKLKDGALERKLAAVRSYPEMVAEVERAFALHGAGAFRIECLRPADPGEPARPPPRVPRGNRPPEPAAGGTAPATTAQAATRREHNGNFNKLWSLHQSTKCLFHRPPSAVSRGDGHLCDSLRADSPAGPAGRGLRPSHRS